MEISKQYSAKVIERQYLTGEEPVQVMCTDKTAYICKYKRSEAPAYKLVCELLGACMAKAWRLLSPEVALVEMKKQHWSGTHVQKIPTNPLIGSSLLLNVIDVTPITSTEIPPSRKLTEQLLRIALFDFWMANEDRNANNANLLYDIENDNLVSIDYGCVLNTASFDWHLTQLTSTETILNTDLFRHISSKLNRSSIDTIIESLQEYYSISTTRSVQLVATILETLPQEWGVARELVSEKLGQLFENAWLQGAWTNFVDNLKDNI